MCEYYLLLPEFEGCKGILLKLLTQDVVEHHFNNIRREFGAAPTPRAALWAAATAAAMRVVKDATHKSNPGSAEVTERPPSSAATMLFASKSAQSRRRYLINALITLTSCGATLTLQCDQLSSLATAPSDSK